MPDTSTYTRLPIGEPFQQEPNRWGRRGGRSLWLEMDEYFAQALIPADVQELREKLEAAFLALTGDPFRVSDTFSLSGMPMAACEVAESFPNSGGIMPCPCSRKGPMKLKAHLRFSAPKHLPKTIKRAW